MSDFDNKNIDNQLVWWIEEKFANLKKSKTPSNVTTYS